MTERPIILLRFMPTKPTKPKRITPTKALERRVILEARGQCPWCEKPVVAAEVEIHHIDGDRSNSVFENLLLTCRNHHGQIEGNLIPHWEVMLKKQMLSNPSVIERLGLMPKAAHQPAPTLIGGDNHGVAGQQVNIGTLNIPRQKGAGRRSITPGLIEADPDMRTYATYLVKRYIDWRKKGGRMDPRKFSPGSAHGILAEGFGSPDSVLLIPQARFLDLVRSAQNKINATIFGKINSGKGKRNYHTWEEHLSERRSLTGGK